jgi:cyclase
VLKPRIIPSLLLCNGELVKTTNFQNPKYVGDPINAVKIFNEKLVDEIMILDISATVSSKEPDYDLIKNLANECRMPICYGGGIKNLSQALKVFQLGIEKIAISSAFIEQPELISELARLVGNQSVVLVLDVKIDNDGKYKIWTHNGSKPTGLELQKFLLFIKDLGIGEIVINSIDRDGTMTGLDNQIIEIVRSCLHIPHTILGGASSLLDVQSVISKYGIIGIGAGSLFVFKGRLRAVLITYPDPTVKSDIITEALLNFKSLNGQ